MNLPNHLILFNFLIMLCTWAGALLSIWTNGNRRYVKEAISFSGGIILGVAFLHMLPEAAHLLGNKVGIFVLAGFLLIYVLERFVMLHACEEDHCAYHHVGVAAFWGLALHSLLNGMALGSSLLVPGLGFTVFLATVTHKAPESFSLVSLLTLGKRNSSVLLGYVAVLSLMVPLGSALVLFGLHSFDETAKGAAIAISAGTFLRIATGDILPGTHLKNGDRWKTLAWFCAGLSVTVLTLFLEA